MLKPLTTNYKDREITLECTHKKVFPPPQMYGSTPDDIDVMWKQGSIDQNQYQQLKVWGDNCGLMVMGPKCLDCPLALKQNPRPGRPHVIETEPWLPAKEKMHWDDMKAGKLAPPVEETPVEAEPTLAEVLATGDTAEGADVVVEEAEETLPDSTVEEPEEAEGEFFEEEEEEPESEEEESEPDTPEVDDDDFLSSLAED